MDLLKRGLKAQGITETVDAVMQQAKRFLPILFAPGQFQGRVAPVVPGAGLQLPVMGLKSGLLVAADGLGIFALAEKDIAPVIKNKGIFRLFRLCLVDEFQGLGQFSGLIAFFGLFQPVSGGGGGRAGQPGKQQDYDWQNFHENREIIFFSGSSDSTSSRITARARKSWNFSSYRRMVVLSSSLLAEAAIISW